MTKKCIEIEMNEDGSFMVTECEPKAEMMEQPVPGLPPEQGQGEANGQTFQNIDQAMQAAKQLLMQTPDKVAGEQDAQDAQAGFDSVQAPQKPGMVQGGM